MVFWFVLPLLSGAAVTAAGAAADVVAVAATAAAVGAAAKFVRAFSTLTPKHSPVVTDRDRVAVAVAEGQVRVIKDALEESTGAVKQVCDQSETSRATAAHGPAVEADGKAVVQREVLVQEMLAANISLQEELARVTAQLEQRKQVIAAKEAAAQQFPVPDFLRRSQRAGNINIGVTGLTGVGKSTFINALRFLKPKDLGAAATSGSGQCTMEPTMYDLPSQPRVRLERLRRWAKGQWDRLRGRRAGDAAAAAAAASSHAEMEEEEAPEFGDGMLLPGRRVVLKGSDPPKMAVLVTPLADGDHWEASELGIGSTLHISKADIADLLADGKIWDLPGVGTNEFPQDTYVKIMGLRYFDTVIFVAGKRFTQAEKAIMQELHTFEVPYFVVRTHIDNDDREAREDARDQGEDEEESVQAKLDEVRAAVAKETNTAKVYLVASRPSHWEKWDFPSLREDINVAVHLSRQTPDEDTECGICFQKYSDCGGSAGEQQWGRPCGHALCSHCWMGWLADSPTCPFCRAEITGCSSDRGLQV